MSRRLERVAEQLRAEIARILREDAGDPRLALLSLTRVDVSPDLSQAIVFWSRIETDDATPREAVEAALAGAAAFLRRRLARELPLKRMPALSFRHDRSLELGDRALDILRGLDHEPTG